jgi:integrase
MYFDDLEVKRLRRACEDWAIADGTQGRTTGRNVWMIVDLAISTGLRVSELAGLTISDLDYPAGAIRVQRRKKREEVTEYVPLSPKLADHLKDYIGTRTDGPVVLGQRGPMSSRGWQQAWLHACRKAEVRQLSIHKARHTAATILYRNTHDLRLVQKQLGHSDPGTTAIYADVSFQDMQSAAAKMFD